MSNLIQETDQELMNHICVVCDKSFPSGRSLGGHMRSHVINSDHHDDDVVDDDDHHHHKYQKQNQMKMKKKQMKKLSCVNNEGLNSKDLGYELRKDPKKTTKVKDASEVNNNNNSNCLVVLDKLCKECGKGFQSWKALFGHMKCHSEKVSNKHTNKNMNQDSWTSHSENENSGVKSGRIKKSRSRMKRYTVTSTTVTTTTTTITTASSSISMNANNNNHASTSVVSDIEQDQESEIAMCLMMLSRDEGKWGHEIESSDHCKSSAFVRLTKVEAKKPTGNGSKIKKIAENQIGSDYVGRSEVGSTGMEKIVIQNDEFDDKMESSKRKFECITCNKSFHSYQALGGHKASHKKLKESPDSKPEDDDKTVENKPFFNNDQIIGSLKKIVVLGAHECPICFKVFSSGQALGGHKRSHMVAEAKLNQQASMNLIGKVDEPVCESRGFIDLNMLPDTMEDDMIMNSSTTEYKPWHWVDTANHESTTLLGLLSTS